MSTITFLCLVVVGFFLPTLFGANPTFSVRADLILLMIYSLVAFLLVRRDVQS